MSTGTMDRTRTRNRLYLIGLLPALLMLLVSGRIGLLLLEQSSGLSDYGDGQYAAARDAFHGNQVLAPFERWVAPFDEGTARHRDKDWPGAVASYVDALEHVPAEWECAVRNNLALAHEALGDAARKESRREDAEAAWVEGREVLAPCLAQDERRRRSDKSGKPAKSADEKSDSQRKSKRDRRASNPGGSGGGFRAQDPDRDDREQKRDRRTADAIDDRLADKLGQATPVEAPDAADPEDPDETQKERERRLAERNRRALEERLRQQQRQEDRRDRRDRENQESGTGLPPPPPQW